MKKYLYTLLCTAMLMPMPASSVPLSGVGVTDFPINGTTAALRPELAGIVLEDVISNFTISGAGETLSGTIQNRVVRSSLDGTVDFYWRIVPTGGNGDLSAFRALGFGNFPLDADWRIDGLGDIEPDTAKYFGDGSGSVNFLFDNEVGGDRAKGYTESKFFFLDTDATIYDMSGSFDLLCADSGCISSLYNTFAPAVIPVPAAAWLFGSGLIGLLSMRRHKSKTHAISS